MSAQNLKLMFLRELNSRVNFNSEFKFGAASYPRTMSAWKKFVAKPYFIPMRGLTVHIKENYRYLSRSFTKFPAIHEIKDEIATLLWNRDVKFKEAFIKHDGSLIVFNINGELNRIAWHSKGSATNEFAKYVEETVINELGKALQIRARTEEKSISFMSELTIDISKLLDLFEKSSIGEELKEFLKNQKFSELPPALVDAFIDENLMTAMISRLKRVLDEEQLLPGERRYVKYALEQLANAETRVQRASATRAILLAYAHLRDAISFSLLGTRVQENIIASNDVIVREAESDELYAPKEVFLCAEFLLENSRRFDFAKRDDEIVRLFENVVKYGTINDIEKLINAIRQQKNYFEGYVAWLDGDKRAWASALLRKDYDEIINVPQWMWPDMLVKIKFQYYVYFVHGLKLGQVLKALDLFIDDFDEDVINDLKSIKALLDSIRELSKVLREKGILDEEKHQRIVKQVTRISSMSVTSESLKRAKKDAERLLKYLKTNFGEKEL